MEYETTKEKLVDNDYYHLIFSTGSRRGKRNKDYDERLFKIKTRYYFWEAKKRWESFSKDKKERYTLMGYDFPTRLKMGTYGPFWKDEYWDMEKVEVED